MRGWRAIAAAVVCVACDGGAASVDAGADGEVVPRTDAGVAIADPAPPSFLPCPSGWREVVADGLTVCDPYPEGGARTDCADDEAHFPGEPGCARVGTECPADGWPADLPAAPTLYVRAGATGDGSSRDAPLGSVAEALARAAPGSVVAVAVGTYDEAVAIGEGVTVVGACVAGTRLTNGDPDLHEGVVRFTGEGAVLRNLAIAGAARPGILSEATGGVSLRVEDVIVSDVIALGIALDGGRLEGRSVVVRDVGVDPASGMYGRGIGASNATVELARVVIERTRSTGVLASGPRCAYTLSDAVVRDTFDRPDALLGRGVTAQQGAHVELARVLVDRSREVGVAAFNEGSSIAITDVVIRDTLGRDGDGEYGTGVQVLEGTTVAAERLVVERSRTHGVSAAGVGATFTGTDLVIRDTEAERASSAFGGGVVADDGASATVARAVVLRSRQAGIGLGGAGTTVSLGDVTIREVASDLGTGRFGVGLWAQSEATLAGERVRIEATRTAGIGAVSGARVVLTDARVLEVRSAECAETTCPAEAAAVGAFAHFYGGSVRLTRFAIGGAGSCGVAVGRALDEPADPGGEMDLEDGVIASAPVGACVQVDGFDPSRLQSRVRYEDVGVPLQATSYELPEALPTP